MESMCLRLSIPTNYYSSYQPFTKPRVFKTKFGNHPTVQYVHINKADEEKALNIVKKKQNLQCLDWSPRLNWLDDEVVTSYMELISSEARLKNIDMAYMDPLNIKKMMSLDVTSANRDVTRFTEKYKNIIHQDAFLGAIHSERRSHWYLLVILPREKSMFVLDSKLINCYALEEAMLLVYNEVSTVLDKFRLLIQRYGAAGYWDYYLVPPQHMPQQENGSDCGVFMTQAALSVVFGLPLDFKQTYISSRRKKMVLELEENCIFFDTVTFKPKIPDIEVKNTYASDKIIHTSDQQNSFMLDEDLPSFKGQVFSLDDDLPVLNADNDPGLSDISDDTMTVHDIKGRIIESSTVKRHQNSGHQNIDKPVIKEGRKREKVKCTKALQSKSLAKAKVVDCCLSDCMTHFTTEEIWNSRSHYHQLTLKQQRKYLYTIFEQNTGKSYKSHYCVNEKQCCAKAFCLLHGLSMSSYYEKMASFKRCSSTFVEEPREGMEYPSAKYLQAKQWLQSFAGKYGDIMPDSVHGDCHLPSCLTKKEVWQKYCDDESGLLSYSRFRSMWKKECSIIKIPKNSRFTKCDTCVHFKHALHEASNKQDVTSLKQQRWEHLNLQKNARQKYYKHISKARKNPKKYVSLITDKMDQSTTALPHITTKSKSDQNIQLMKMNITGVLCHSHNRAYSYMWTSKYADNSNITIHAILSTLHDIAKDNSNCLPSTLYLQMDNASKENKNYYIFGLCALLVKLRIFKKVKVNFLMVGHTHEDIDQMFSKISQTLARNNAMDLPSLISMVEKSYTPPPKCSYIKSMWDYRGLLGETCNQLQGHSSPHVFRFTLDEKTSEPLMSYCNWPPFEDSCRSDKTFYSHLDLSSFFKKELENPKVCSPLADFVQESEALLNTICKLHKSGKLTTEENEWWSRFIAEEIQPVVDPVDNQLNLLHYQETTYTCSISTQLQESISKSKQKERMLPEIKIRGKRKR